MSPETKLCLAAALNGTGFTKEEFDKEVKPLVNGIVEDWFKLNPAETSQWFAKDKEGVLTQLKGADESELRDVLLDMGFSINGDLVSLDGDRWSQFIDEQIAMTNQSIGGVPQSEAEWR